MSNDISKELENENVNVNESINKEIQTEKKKDVKASNKNPEIIIRKDEFIRKLRKEISDDPKYWRLCYMHSSREHVKDLKDDFVCGKVKINGICGQLVNSYHEDPYRMLSANVSYSIRYPGNYGSYYRFLDVNFESINSIKSTCNICTDKLPACIYKVNGYIQFVSLCNGFDSEEIYAELLGSFYIQQEKYQVVNDIKALTSIYYDFIDILTAYAAAVMLKQRWIEFQERSDTYSYSYVDMLANTKNSKINEILEMYDGYGKYVEVKKADFLDHVSEKMHGIDPAYNFYPERVAAYYFYLSKFFNRKPLDIALFVLNRLCERLGFYDEYQLALYRRRLKNLPMNKEDYLLADKMFNYVINHNFNRGIPYMPLNMVLYSEDDQETKELIDIFKWITWFYYYFNGRNVAVDYHEMSLADYKMTDIVNFIDKVKIPEKGEELDKCYVKGPLFLHLKDFELLPELENKAGESKVKITQLQNAIDRQNEKVVIVISGEKDKLKRILEGYNEFYNITVDKHLTLGDMSTNQIVLNIIRKLETNFELEAGFESALKEYVYSEYKKSKLKSKAFIDKAIRDIMFNHYDEDYKSVSVRIKDIPTIEGMKTDKDIWESINSLEGLANVKEEMKKLQTLLTFRRKTMSRGIALSNRPNLHMVFRGNPGTGKTTVARILADLLYNFGYLKENKLIEASPKDLVAQWVGQTAPKTAAICQQAYGGILFIDEAYELAVGNGGGAQDAFRSEAVTELIKQMEDHRDNLVVFFAGYSEEMEKLLDTNPGLASRIGTILDFEDYSEDELMSMFKKFVSKSGMSLTDDAKNVVLERIRDAKAQEDFGNGRYIRNLFEKTITQHAYNTIDSDDDKILSTIESADIPDMEESRKSNKKYRIGFI